MTIWIFWTNFLYLSPIIWTQVTKNNSGLPPRVPSSENKPTNSLGNSSNNSSILNGLNGCDRGAETNLVNNNTKDYSSTTYCLDNDNDNTILSDTSTLNGDSNNIVYINKCSELERTIESLKNRLISKEKELTDLQLKQWSSDYLTEQLKSTISKLEKENAQLKAVMKNYDRVNLWDYNSQACPFIFHVRSLCDGFTLTRELVECI